jgi:hypothetical protein
VKANISQLTIAAAAVAAVTGFGVSPGQAATFGSAPWCAVVDQGAGNMMWECEFATVEACEPYVTAGNRGFCARNPYLEPPPPPPVANQGHRKNDVRD